jgi:hypothetical protein
MEWNIEHCMVIANPSPTQGATGAGNEYEIKLSMVFGNERKMSRNRIYPEDKN